MKFILIILNLCILSISGFAQNNSFKNVQWVATHLLGYKSDEDLERLAEKVPKLSEQGINMIILEVDYHFDFKSHPELRNYESFITLEGARKFSKTCKENNIRVIPEFQCLGHQSWSSYTFPLLIKYPELDLTPGAFFRNKGIYCREWDPTNPKVNEIIFPMIDEIIDAFQADGIHIGMDEVFLIGSKESPSTYGKDAGEIYAKAVNDFYDYFGNKKKLQLFMWGDRLIDGNKYNYGKWESSLNGTHTALDKISKDIVICDWHYEYKESYPSIPLFLEKGFKVLPCSHNNPKGASALIKYSLQQKNPNMIGHLFTSWGSVPKDSITNYTAYLEGLKVLKEQKIWDVIITPLKASNNGEIEVELNTPNKNLSIYYTLNGTYPDKNSLSYSKPIILKQSAMVKAIAFEGNNPAGEVTSYSFIIHLATGKNVQLKTPASKKYPSIEGSAALVNGITSTKSYSDGQWLGFEGEDIEATITLNTTHKISELSFNCFYEPRSWIQPPLKAEVWVSKDGINFEKSTETEVAQTSDSHLVPVRLTIPSIETKYIRVVVPHCIIPQGNSGAGNPGWIFIDEIVVK